MENCKEYLEKQPDGKYALVLRGDLCKESDILIPDGAEIAIKFKNDPDEFGVVFYKNNGKSSFSQKDESWQNDSNWTMQDLLDKDHCENGIDLSHDILWQRTTHPEKLPFIDDGITDCREAIQEIYKPSDFGVSSLNDQYAEIEQVRQQTIESTLSQRQTQYGCYEDVAQVTQQILSALRIGNYDKLPAPMKESLHMIASKMARIVNGDPEYFDNWHDIGGYAKLIEKLIKGE